MVSLRSAAIYFVIFTWGSHSGHVRAVNFDHFIMSFQWPVSFCENKKPAATCKQPIPSYWTIHGFWPTKLNGVPVENCTNNDPFNLEKIHLNTRKEMDKIWPDLLNKNSSGFWTYQWQRHGTCADVNGTRTVAEYFTKTTQIALSYDISAILKNSNIREGEITKIRAIEDGIKSATEHKPYIRLVEINGTRPLWLWEIRLCFSKTFAMIDCNKNNTFLGNVLYPKLNLAFAQPLIPSPNGHHEATASVVSLFIVYIILRVFFL